MSDTDRAFHITDYEVVEAMVIYGGSFVSALGKAYQAADAQNVAKLKAAFPEYWATYTKAAIAKKRQQGEAE